MPAMFAEMVGPTLWSDFVTGVDDWADTICGHIISASAAANEINFRFT